MTEATPQPASRPDSLPESLLLLVGLGPGDPDQMTLAARQALDAAQVVVGYQGYLERIRPLLRPGQELRPSPIGQEMARAEEAVALARQGRRVALVSSGDVGIYAMAGPLFDVLRAQGWDGERPRVEVLPGISAVQAAAARLGAPLSHDFCTISLSDLLTPWPVIQRRVTAAAWGDFVVAFYNPRSRTRDWQLAWALDRLREHRPPGTPVALVRNVTRPDEQVTVTTLGQVDPAQVDMFTLVLVGNSQSYLLGSRSRLHMATPRGYTPQDRTPQAEEVREAESGLAERPAPASDQPERPGLYPLALTDLAQRPALVVGGGPVGERKAQGVLAAGGRVRLVSPQATATLAGWAQEGRIAWERRPYRPGDLAGVGLVFAATDDREVNRAVAQEARARGLLVNVADAPAEGNFHVPALVRRDGLVVAVSTAAGDPRRAIQLRDGIRAWLAESPREQSTRENGQAQSGPGRAYLVGAGPGRAGLITVRGRELLRRADVVIYDRLIAQELLALIRPDAERIFAGKRPGRHVIPQDEINRILVARVQAGKSVVRLKGGDAFVFGRGGEEALALAQAGLPFEVVPGVTSAIAGPAFAGVPVTHRGVATSFAVVAGYEDPSKPQSMTDWSALARIPTLVILMGVKRVQAIVQALLAAGRDPETPALAVHAGSTDQQRVVRATLATLPQAVQEGGIRPPAVMVIGEVAALHDQLAWFQPDGQARGFVELAEESGRKAVGS